MGKVSSEETSEFEWDMQSGHTKIDQLHGHSAPTPTQWVQCLSCPLNTILTLNPSIQA